MRLNFGPIDLHLQIGRYFRVGVSIGSYSVGVDVFRYVETNKPLVWLHISKAGSIRTLGMYMKPFPHSFPHDWSYGFCTGLPKGAQ